MSYTSSNLVLGPANLYAAPVGTTEPLDSSVTPNGWQNPPGGSWLPVGGTDGGIVFNAAGTYTDLTVDQTIMPVGSRLTDLAMDVTTKMSEMTLDNLSLALNQIVTKSNGTGYTTADITVTSVATQPTYTALIVDGWAPFLVSGQPALRRIIVRKALSQFKAVLTYDRKTQQSVDCTFKVYVVSSSVNPVHIVDQTA